MKFCISSKIISSNRNKAHEIKYSLSSFLQAIKYAEDNPNTKIIISISSLSDPNCPPIDKLYMIHKELNVYYEFYNLNDLITYTKYYQDIDYNDKHCMFGHPVISWAMVLILKFYNVTDILIAEPLTFNMNDITEGIKKENIKIRIRPAMSKHVLAKNTNDNGMCHFWVLPQFIHIYENYIDVIDLSFEQTPQREEALLKFFYEGSYDNDLKYYLENFEESFFPHLLDDKFFQKRLNCRQTCMINKNRCHYCDTILNLSKQLKKIENKTES